MASKLAIHITTASQAQWMREFCLRAQPVAVKHVNPDRPLVEYIAANCPNTLQIGRKFWKNGQPWGDGERIARGVMAMSASPVLKLWEGVNEPPRDRLEEVSRSDAVAARILHDNGFKYICGSWSVGVPDISDWLNPAMLEACREADYIGVHEYSAPALDDPRGIEWFLLRHRLWYPQLPADCQKPLIISEGGIDSNAPGGRWDVGGTGGWQSFCNEEEYMSQLAWYDEVLQQDDYVVAVTLFQWGSLDPTWDSYDHTPRFTQLLGDHIIAHADEPPPPPPPVDPPPPSDRRGGIDVSHYQNVIDWRRISKAKVAEFAILRVAYGMELDRRYLDNWLRAGEVGIERGAYHFLRSGNVWEQAWQFFEMVQPSEMGYWLDVEVDPNGPDPTEDDVLTFLRAWRSFTDIPLGIYTSRTAWSSQVGSDAAWASNIPLWVAHWNVDEPSLPDPWEDWEIWQYGGATIPGIDGTVDVNWTRRKT